MVILDKHKLIILTPIFEDAYASSQLFKELGAQFTDSIFVIAVDDGSLNNPIEIRALEDQGLTGIVIKLKRNVGHQKAIAIGLSFVSNIMSEKQYLVVMDSDGEDLPSTIPVLIAQLQSDAIDIVVAERKNRVESIRFKLFYKIYKMFFKLMTGRSIAFGNFMALKKLAVKRLAAMQEISIHIAGAVIASGLRTKALPLDRGPRYTGKSKMNFISLVLHGFKALMVFAEDVLVRVGIACGFIAGLSLMSATAAITLKVIGIATPGWFSVALGILLLMLIQTAALALMTLMLTGIIRSGSVTPNIGYEEFIEKIISTDRMSN